MLLRLLFGLGGLLTSQSLVTSAVQAQNINFNPAVTYSSSGGTPIGIAGGDITGDSIPDLVVTTFINGRLGVLAGVGDGTFNPITTYPSSVGFAPQGVKLGDMNNDGRLDVIVAGTTGVGVLLNLGGGTLGPTSTYLVTVTGNPNSLAVGDLNKDGWLDVATLDDTSGTTSVLLNQGNGTLGPASRYLLGSTGCLTLALGDVTGDGWLDIVASSGGGSMVNVLPSTGTGNFGSLQQLGGGAGDYLTLGDINNDGHSDILVGDAINRGFVVFLSLGNGNFLYAPTYHVAQSGTCPVLADLNGDGLLDLTYVMGAGTNIALVLGMSGGFGVASSLAPGVGNHPICTAVADLNGDSRPDIVAANYSQATVGVFLNGQPGLLLSSLGSGRTGSSLTLRGNNLSGATAATFTSGAGQVTAVFASSFTATSYTTTPNTITLPVPATLAAGTYTIGVSTPHGTTNARPFTVITALALSPQAALNEELGLVPNPAHYNVTITLPAGTGTSHAALYLLNALGQEISAYQLLLPAGGLSYPLALNGLAPGLYLLRVQTGKQQAVRRLLVY